MSLSAPVRVLQSTSKQKEDENDGDNGGQRKMGLAQTMGGSRRGSMGSSSTDINGHSASNSSSNSSMKENNMVTMRGGNMSNTNGNGNGSSSSGVMSDLIELRDREKDSQKEKERERKDSREVTSSSSGATRLSGAVRTNQNQNQVQGLVHPEFSTSTALDTSSGAKRIVRPPPPQTQAARDRDRDRDLPPTGGGSGTGSSSNGSASTSGRGEKIEKIEKVEQIPIVEQEVAYTLESLKIMCEDAHWGNRLKGFEVITEKLNAIIEGKKIIKNKSDSIVDPGSTSTDQYDSKDKDKKDSKDRNGLKECFLSSTVSIECVVDLAVNHLGDAHQKVAVEAMSVLGMCIQGLTAQTMNKLGVLLSALFNRLADRRAQIK